MRNTVKLGDVLKTGAGGTPLKSKKNYYEGGSIKWLLSGAVCEKDIYDCKTHITQEGLANSSAKLFPKNTVLVAMYGATAGQVGILRTEAATNQAVCGIYPSKDYLPEFLYYYLSNYKDTLLLEVSGVAQPNLSQVKIKNIPLPCIPITEQQRIVAKLDAAFAEIDNMLKSSQSKRTEVKSLPTQILKKTLEDEAYDWTSERLSSISDNLDSQRIPITKSKRNEGNIPYYGASGIVDYVEDFIFDDELLLISEDGANLLARTYPIAFSVEGKTWVNNHAHVLKFENKMLQKWVEYYLNSTNIEAFVSGMAQPKLNQKKLNEIPIPCPKPNLLPKLLSNLEKVISQSERVFELETQKTKKIEKLKSAILTHELQSEAE